MSGLRGIPEGVKIVEIETLWSQWITVVLGINRKFSASTIMCLEHCPSQEHNQAMPQWPDSAFPRSSFTVAVTPLTSVELILIYTSMPGSRMKPMTLLGFIDLGTNNSLLNSLINLHLGSGNKVLYIHTLNLSSVTLNVL